MAVTLTGTSSGAQGLFNRLGAIGYRLNLLNGYRTSIGTDAAAAMALHDGANAAIRGTVSALPAARLAAQSSVSSLATAYRAAAEQTLIEMFDADSPLSKRDKQTALETLIKQMRTATTSYVTPNTVSAAVTQTSLTGNGNVVVSVQDGLGYNLENLLAETILINCNSATTAGSERIRFRGAGAEADKLSHRWPLGSGVDTTLTSLQPGASGDLLTNGDFEDFTTNAPDGWTIVAGTAGSTIDDETSTIYAGAKSLKFGGNGSVLHQITQTIANLESQVPYAVNFWCRNSSNPAAGVLTIDLYDGSSVINDEAGTANSFTVDLTTLGTTFVPKYGVFRLPDPVPSTVTLRVRCSTAITNTHNLFIDQMCFSKMTKLSTSLPGATPYVKVFSGSTNWSTDDGRFDFPNVWKLVTSNNRTCAWTTLMDRLFNLAALDMTLPTSGTTLINDSLIA